MAHADDRWEAPVGFNFTRDVVEQLAADPGRPALTFVDADGVIERQTFAQVAADAARWAHLLRGSGYQPGDRVLVLLGNATESIAVLLGAIKCGLIAVPCPGSLRPPDVAFRARHSSAALLIADRSAETEVDTMRGLLGADLDVLYHDEAQALLKRCRPVAPTEVTAADHCAFVLYTSGVTGEPKGVAHTHAATYAARMQAEHWLDAGPGDIVWSTAANWWGHTWNVLGPWSLGAEIVMHAGGFDPEERLDLLEFLGVSILGQTPREYDLLAELDRLETSRPTRLRHAVSAGEPLSRAAITRFHEAFGIVVCDGYGQAENALLLAGVPSRMSQAGSMGFPVPGHHVAVIDEHGQEMPLGEEGDIALHGRPPTLFDRYWGDPDETEAVFRGAWYVTGDRATRDEDGSFWFTGRVDDVILADAHRVGAFEVERVLLDHPSVAESAVVGKPDADHGQAVKAFVVLRAGLEASDELADELRRHATSDPLAYAHPSEIEFVTELPRTTSGKIRRLDLRRLELARAGVEDPSPDEVARLQVDDRRRATESGRRAGAARGRAAERERRAAVAVARRAEEARARADAEQSRQEARAQRQAAKDARQAEKETKRDEQARVQAEAAVRAKLEEQRRRAEKEEARSEAARVRAEADERRRQEKAQREAEKPDREARKAEEARVRAETEERRRQEEARRRAEQEAKQAAASRSRSEAKERAQLEEAQRRAEQEAHKAEESRLRAEAKERARAEEVQRRADEEARKAEESRLRAEAKERARLEEVQRRSDEEARQAEAERVRAEEEQRRRSVNDERKAETERLRLEHERLRADVKAVQKAEVEERRQAGEDLKRATAAEDRSRRDEKQRADEEAARRANQEAVRRSEVEAARRKLAQAERQRRRPKPRPPERATTRSQPDEEESELGATLVERLQAYGHGGGSDGGA